MIISRYGLRSCFSKRISTLTNSKCNQTRSYSSASDKKPQALAKSKKKKVSKNEEIDNYNKGMETIRKYDPNFANNTSTKLHGLKKSLLVPKVASTDNLSSAEIQTEGLFAGYRPLFLGNSSLETNSKLDVLDNFFTSFANLKVSAPESETDSYNSGQIKDVIDDLQNGLESEQEQSSLTRENRKPIIPWDASIGGMVYSDKAFKDLPKSVVSKLSPFKLVKLERSQDKSQVKPKRFIKIKVHNSKVSDDLEMVNLFDSDKTKHYDKHIQDGSIIGVTRDQMIKDRKEYENEMNHYLLLFRFLKSDQRLYITYLDKLMRFLERQIFKKIKLHTHSPVLLYRLPIFIYLPPSSIGIKSLRRILRKQIINQSSPLMSILLPCYEKEFQREKLLSKFNNKVNTLLNDLIIALPSYHIHDTDTDCIIQQSPVPNFKRLYWLKPTLRKNVFYGKNIHQEYVFNYSKSYDITRSNIKYMRYPIGLRSKTVKEAFSKDRFYD
ncbi:hypothetical protein TPHA_0P01260 [Tetrapisispora phaffii CBS 4417]|uniref:Uncharacterized protein n=1 Tax=Tetrapisispora phaffii (strain ATCC 24235 / CBS 4417 / NBRC 1672 / NRRL Y-8282 / UCD 70-5) TaxID=1071381 RepID=G8C2A6_TETPH|nr:hypothetical protein TPHA_0P01260 [Tetrapisispora phaffii CBS 4417]CCE66284.1 hypothetical protein TPHA_0P01260 [Tetrapisispora phaffii CBS 4417]